MRHLFTVEEEARVVAAIREVERRSSGEVRVFIEEFCPTGALERAASLFLKNGMERTLRRNGVLIYLAFGTRELAIWGDRAIHEIVGQDFWQTERDLLKRHFRKNEFAEGLVAAIAEVGAKLAAHFPHEAGDDVNELPDEIIYG